jgi:hypothetical protein
MRRSTWATTSAMRPRRSPRIAAACARRPGCRRSPRGSRRCTARRSPISTPIPPAGRVTAGADAAFTRRPGACARFSRPTACRSCWPAESGDRVAAAHAGWRGLAAGVIEATVTGVGGGRPRSCGVAGAGHRARGTSRSGPRCARTLLRGDPGARRPSRPNSRAAGSWRILGGSRAGAWRALGSRAHLRRRRMHLRATPIATSRIGATAPPGRQATLIWLEAVKQAAGVELPACPQVVSIPERFSRVFAMRMDKLTTKFQAALGRCPVARRGPRQSIHRAGAPDGGAARPTGRHRAAAAREGGRQCGQAALRAGGALDRLPKVEGRRRRGAARQRSQQAAERHRQARAAARRSVHLERTVRARGLRGPRRARPAPEGQRGADARRSKRPSRRCAAAPRWRTRAPRRIVRRSRNTAST